MIGATINKTTQMCDDCHRRYLTHTPDYRCGTILIDGVWYQPCRHRLPRSSKARRPDIDTRTDGFGANVMRFLSEQRWRLGLGRLGTRLRGRRAPQCHEKSRQPGPQQAARAKMPRASGTAAFRPQLFHNLRLLSSEFGFAESRVHTGELYMKRGFCRICGNALFEHAARVLETAKRN